MSCIDIWSNENDFIDEEKANLCRELNELDEEHDHENNVIRNEQTGEETIVDVSKVNSMSSLVRV